MAVISVSEQEDIPAGSGPNGDRPLTSRQGGDPRDRVASSRKQFKPVDEEESERVVEKRRMSLDLPEEARIVAHIPPEVEDHVTHPKRSATPEVDTDGGRWDDLDAEDADDSLMVSEYVTEIFAYLQEVEVSESSTILFFIAYLGSSRKRRCLTLSTRRCKGPRVEDARHLDWLAHSSSFAISSAPGDSFPLRQHHRSFPFRPRYRQAATCRDHVCVCRCQGGRDYLTFCFQLLLLCRLRLLRK